jgi:hypothetical protein
MWVGLCVGTTVVGIETGEPEGEFAMGVMGASDGAWDVVGAGDVVVAWEDIMGAGEFVSSSNPL